jgi:signal peptidase I
MSAYPAPPLPGRAKAGIVAALILVLLYWGAALWVPLPALLQGAVFAAVARGLWKRNAWAGYGGALILLASVVGSLLAGARASMPPASLVTGAFFFGLAALFLFRAGFVLSEESRGRAAVWVAAASVTLVFPLVYQPFIHPTSSMEATVFAGDHLLVRRIALPKPARGQLVVFRYPADPAQVFLKRIAAAGGDRVRIVDKKLFINGVAAQDPHARHTSTELYPFRDNFPGVTEDVLPMKDWPTQLKANTVNGELVVPQGKLFVLGDNRDASLDSRYWGFLDPEAILGTPDLIYFSVEGGAAGPEMTPALLEPSKIRWSRIFRPL